MAQPNSFSDIIELWPSSIVLGSDLGIPPATVRAWKKRGHIIPCEYWWGIEAASRARGFRGVRFHRLAWLAARDAGRVVA